MDRFPRLLDIAEQADQRSAQMDIAELRDFAKAEALVPHLGSSFNLIPLTEGWFRAIEEKRHGRHGEWLPRHLEFNRHQRERVLCIGPCLGTDWVNYALNGAEVTVAAESRLLEPILMNFQWRGLTARDRKSTRLNSSHTDISRMPSSA